MSRIVCIQRMAYCMYLSLLLASSYIPIFIDHCCVYLPQDQYGATPMIPACNYGHLQVVKYLTQGGADVNKQTKVSFLSFFVSTIYTIVTSL